VTAGTMGPGDHQHAQLNGAIGELPGLGQAAGSSGERVVRIVLDYLAVLERAAPAVALRHRGSGSHGPANVERTDPERTRLDRDTDGITQALAHLLVGEVNRADDIVIDLDPSDLAAVRVAANQLAALCDTRVSQLLRLRKIGPGAR
jgi:hypothetical protein